MWSESYDWHFDYARLAFDAGFSFKSRKSKSCFEKEYIKNVDIGKLIQDRNTSTVEKYIPSVIEYSLDNDQTSILDPTFLKIFQLSQLAVEYLLFCKKYLDNTVVILKKGIFSNSEEISDLKQELRQKDEEIELLEMKMKEIKSSKLQYHTYKDDVSAFQCPQCCKVFASKDFLEAHNKRRHQEPHATSAFQQETDKLQTEIKELKERLNTTEKLVHKSEYPKREFLSPNEVGIGINDDKKLINELHQKFELLKVYVEGELKSLQFQSTDQSKYEKWFEVFLQRLESLMQKSYTTNTETNNIFQKQLETNNVDLKNKKSDSSVQTEEKFTKRNVCEKCEARSKEESDFGRIQTQLVGKMLTDLKETTESQLNSLEFALTGKVNNSLEKLDRQIRNLNEKVDEMVAKSHTKLDNNNLKSSNDNNRYTVVPVPKKRQFITGNKVNKSVIDYNKVNAFVNSKEHNEYDSSIHVNKVIPLKLENSLTPQKYRKEFDQRKNQNQTHCVVPKGNENKRDSVTAISRLKKKSSTEPAEKSSSGSLKVLFNNVPANTNIYSTDDDNSTTSEINEDTIKKDYVKIVPSTSTLGKRSLTSLKAASLDKEVLQGLKKEVQNIFHKRLEAVGISSSTKGISHSLYEKVLSVINKERSKMAEKYPQYEKISSSITKTLEDRMKLSSKESKLDETVNENVKKTESPTVAVKKFSQRQKGGSRNVAALQQQKAPKTSSSISSSEEDEKIVTEDIIKRLTKPNKNLQKSYQSYSDVVKQINEKMQKRALEKTNNNDDVIDLQDDSNTDGNISSSGTSDKKSTNMISNFKDLQKREESKEAKGTKDKMDVVSIESFTDQIVEDQSVKNNNLLVEELNGNEAQRIVQQQPKSALKNLPTKSLPVKKKVFFDLESMADVEIKEDVGGGGDTTSATSSIFDDIESLKEVKKTTKKEKDSDLSDFNFSDIL